MSRLTIAEQTQLAEEYVVLKKEAAALERKMSEIKGKLQDNIEGEKQLGNIVVKVSTRTREGFDQGKAAVIVEKAYDANLISREEVESLIKRSEYKVLTVKELA